MCIRDRPQDSVSLSRGENTTLEIHGRHDPCICLLYTSTAFSLPALMELLQGRKDQPQEGSYTSYLFDKGLDKILKKVGEEATEVIIAGKAEDKKETVYEIADLAYHVMVLMLQLGISLEDVGRELASRHVIDKKVKQEKMT